MSEDNIEKQEVFTSYVGYCSECECSIPTTEADFVNCTICGDKLENHRQMSSPWLDPKYTTRSC